MLLLVSHHFNLYILLATVNFEIGTSSNSASGSGSPTPAIAGSVGGVVLFLIILFIVVFIYCKRQSQKKDYAVSTVPNKGLQEANIYYVYICVSLVIIKKQMLLLCPMRILLWK